MKSAVLIGVMALVTIFLRFLPFLVFRNRTPKYISSQEYVSHYQQTIVNLPNDFH